MEAQALLKVPVPWLHSLQRFRLPAIRMRRWPAVTSSRWPRWSRRTRGRSSPSNSRPPPPPPAAAAGTPHPRPPPHPLPPHMRPRRVHIKAARAAPQHPGRSRAQKPRLMMCTLPPRVLAPSAAGSARRSCRSFWPPWTLGTRRRRCGWRWMCARWRRLRASRTRPGSRGARQRACSSCSCCMRPPQQVQPHACCGVQAHTVVHQHHHPCCMSSWR